MRQLLFSGEREILGSTRVTGNIVSKQISFILKPDDNQAEYRCNATNPATVEPFLATKTLTVNCEFFLLWNASGFAPESGITHDLSTIRFPLLVTSMCSEQTSVFPHYLVQFLCALKAFCFSQCAEAKSMAKSSLSLFKKNWTSQLGFQCAFILVKKPFNNIHNSHV